MDRKLNAGRFGGSGLGAGSSGVGKLPVRNILMWNTNYIVCALADFLQHVTLVHTCMQMPYPLLSELYICMCIRLSAKLHQHSLCS